MHKNFANACVLKMKDSISKTFEIRQFGF